MNKPCKSLSLIPETILTLDQMIDHCAKQKKENPNGILFVQSDGTEIFESYPELYLHARQILGSLQNRGIQRGAHIIFQINNNHSFLVLFWGCILGGMIPVPLPVPIMVSPDTEAFNKLKRVAEALPNAAIVADRRVLTNFSSLYSDCGFKYLDYEKLSEGKGKGECAALNSSDTAYIQYSSGSTGEPKGVVLTHKNILSNIYQITDGLNIQKNDVMGSWMPLTHNMGLIGTHFAPMFEGMTHFLMDTNVFIQTPWLFLQKIGQLNVTLSASPNFGLEWMMDKTGESHLKNIDLSKLRALFCGAEPISMDTIRRFYKKFSDNHLKKQTIHHVYGMAEACVAITLTVGDHDKSVHINRHKNHIGQNVEYLQADDDNAAEFAVLGWPGKGIELAIVDDHDIVLPENQIGHIVIKGPNVFGGYLHQAEVPFNKQGFFRTGDLGFLCNGELVIAGREKDIIFVNGQNYYASDIENVLSLASPELSRTVVCASRGKGVVRDKVLVFMHYEGEIDSFLPFDQKIRKIIFERIGIVVDCVIPTKDIPKTTSGKVQRYRLVEQFENKLFDDVLEIISSHGTDTKKEITAKDKKIEIRILEIARNIFAIPLLQLDDVILQSGINSLSMMRFLDELHRIFRVKIDLIAFWQTPTIRQLSSLVEQKAQKDDPVFWESELEDNSWPGDRGTGNSDLWHLPFPLTEIQEAYLIGRQNIEMGNISTHAYYEIETDLSIQRLNEALNQVIAHQPMLRAVFDENGQQRILSSPPCYSIKTEDLRELSKDEQTERISEHRRRKSHFVYHHGQWPLFEFFAFTLEEGRHYLCIDIDLLIADGNSLLIFVQEVMEFYHHPGREAEALSFQFSDYVKALQGFSQSSAYQRDRAYWQSKIDEFPPAPQLPLVCGTETVNKPTFKRLEKVLPAEDWTIIKNLAQQKGVTLSGVLCTLYAEILGKWANQPKMALNLTLFNRQGFHPDVMRIIGDFTSLLVLDIDLTVHRGFWERASEIQRTLFEALDHRLYNGVSFIRDLARRQGRVGQAIMPIVFTSMLFEESEHINTHIDSLGELKYGISQTPQVFLDFQVMERGNRLSLTWDYVEEMFDGEMIASMFQTFLLRLRQLIDHKMAMIPLPPKDLEILAQYHHRAKADVRTGQSGPQRTLLHELIDRQCRETPHAVAIKQGDETLSFAQLARQSNQIAHYLREQGCEHGSYVGVWAKRHIGTIINIVGILKAGCAYVPVNPEYPQERIEYILSNSGCTHLLHPDLYEREQLSGYNEAAPDYGVNGEDRAYVIFTSGSTGHPKGVIITHEAVVNTVTDINERFAVSTEDKIIALSSMSFDLSVYDIFGALISGAQLVLIPDLLDMNMIHQVLSKEEITVWNSVPTIMDTYLENSAHGTTPIPPNQSLRLVMLSGDWIPLGLPVKINKQFPRAAVISLGGATEASIWSIYYPITEVQPQWKSIPYGYPLRHQYIHVLDAFGEECPVGVPGELYIGGQGVSLGYINEEEKTRAAFLRHRLGYIYRTGDYGVLRKEGYIEFLGRKDSQVKIRGHRIELGEIEAQLRQHSEVQNAVVAIQEHPDGDKQLVGYVVPKDKKHTEALDKESFFICEKGDDEGAKTRWEAVIKAGETSSEHIPDDLSFERVAEFSDKLEELATAYIYKGIKDLGIYECVGQRENVTSIIKRCRIKPHYKKLFIQWLDVLCEDGILERNEQEIYTSVSPIPDSALDSLWKDLKRYPAYGAWQEMLNALEICGNTIMELLRGEVNALDILFPDGSWGRAENIYRYNPFAKFYNSIVSGIIKSAVACYPEDKGVRILEFGAGTGGTTASILPNLPPQRTEYIYTDLSTFFTNEAKKMFQKYPFMQYGIFDIDTDPCCQGYAAHSFDIIIGANVLHDARDINSTVRNLKSLLAPHGLFIILEATRNVRLHKVSIGFLEGLSSYADERMKENAPLLSAETWRQKFMNSGFSEVASFPGKHHSLVSFEQHVVVAKGPATIEKMDPKAVQSYLLEKLPTYMVPSFFVTLETIPLTANGKVDKKALPMPQGRAGRDIAYPTPAGIGPYTSPRTPEEKLVTEAFEKALGIERVSVTDSLFDLGGDSINAIRILNKIRESGYNSSVRNIMTERTPEHIARNLVMRQESISAEQGEVSGDIPLTPIQHCFFHHCDAGVQLMPCPEHFNLSQLYAVQGAVSPEALRKVLSALAEHHDMLRVTYQDKQQIIGKIDAQTWYSLTKIECSSGEMGEKAERVQTSMNLSTGPLLQAALFHTPGKDYVLLAIHHMAVDRVSWRILSEDLESGYRQALNNEEIKLPAKTVSFKAWSLALNRYRESAALKQEAAYWAKVQEKIAEGRLKEDGSGGEYAPKTSIVCLDISTTEKLLKKSTQAYNTEINDLLLAALGRAAYRLTGQRTLALQLEGHGREKAETVGAYDLSRTVGWFTSLYPVVLEDLGSDIGQDIRNTKETLRRVPEQGIGYGILMQENKAGAESNTEATPDISFTYLGEFEPEKGQGDPHFVASELLPEHNTDPRNCFGPALNINGFTRDGMLMMTVTCNSDRYSSQHIECLCNTFEKELAAVAEHCSQAQTCELTASDFGETVWTDSEFREMLREIEG